MTLPLTTKRALNAVKTSWKGNYQSMPWEILETNTHQPARECLYAIAALFYKGYLKFSLTEKGELFLEKPNDRHSAD
jgi:hypothetical protein